MAENNTVLVVAVLAVIASLAAAGFSYYSLSNEQTMIISGLATGTAKLTVTTDTTINFSVDTVDFGSGRVKTGQTSTTLETGVAAPSTGTWTGNQTALVLDNIGNTNASIDIKADTDATGLLGGTTPSFQIKVTEKDSGSCTNQTTGTFGVYTDINATDVRYCDRLRFVTSTNRLQVDVKLVVPQDSLKGLRSSNIIATGNAVA